ncbi:MAG: tryptophan 2,3-dioxygenase [Paracoccaceae bacterium]
MSTCPFNPASDGAQMSFDGRMSYGDYLRIDQILGAQETLTTAHDEMLFIIQHQTSELWMRLALHELDAARMAIAADRAPEAFKMLARVARIFEQLTGAWDVLRTMTPSDYTHFRDDLGQSSGFQSWQYRLIEYALGNRNHAMRAPHAHRPDILARLDAELARPSLYDAALGHLARMGLPVPAQVLNRDVSQAWTAQESVQNLWEIVYRTPGQYWQAYELAEKLMDIEDHFRRWRFNHVTTVERVIGFKRGTGGTSGVAYLRRMLDIQLFPELWSLRTAL